LLILDVPAMRLQGVQ